MDLGFYVKSNPTPMELHLWLIAIRNSQLAPRLAQKAKKAKKTKSFVKKAFSYLTPAGSIDKLII